MDSLERRKFELHADQGEYQQRVRTAERWVHRVFDRFESPCLHVSGGKDSLVLWHLVSERAGYGSVPVFHFDNGVLNVPGVTDYVRDLADRLGGRLFVRTSGPVQDEQMVLEKGHGYAGYWGQYHDLADMHGWNVRLLGIRAEESPRRRDRFAGEGLPVDGDGHQQAVAPIHALTVEDVWAYIVAHNLPYHDLYDEQGALFDDIAHPRNRLVTIYDREFKSLGSLELSQFLFPDATSRAKDLEHRE